MMYRILRERGQSGERRRQGTHPAKTVPELVADGSSQVLTWDITKAAGPHRARHSAVPGGGGQGAGIVVNRCSGAKLQGRVPVTGTPVLTDGAAEK
ncbi:hypothetical protein DN069_22825 [Streptacidiphilus pinicola]|uniref:Uncharacterized protein n=1 Tax=Streptacidiphilus pinicola TaxID=2219663 RepID=A0A2X0IED9_9ACTN|nr:hypothetical protein DN069_22825 [Streptacidiphilus pinicola]